MDAGCSNQTDLAISANIEPQSKPDAIPEESYTPFYRTFTDKVLNFYPVYIAFQREVLAYKNALRDSNYAALNFGDKLKFHDFFTLVELMSLFQDIDVIRKEQRNNIDNSQQILSPTYVTLEAIMQFIGKRRKDPGQLLKLNDEHYRMFVSGIIQDILNNDANPLHRVALFINQHQNIPKLMIKKLNLFPPKTKPTSPSSTPHESAQQES